MTCSRGIEFLVYVLLAKFFCNFFLIHLVDSLTKLSSCTNKIGAVVASYFAYLTATGDEAAKCVKEGVCIEGVGDFNMNSSAYKACKQCPISFAFLATFFRYVRSKIVHSDVSEGGCRGQSVLGQISHFLVLRGGLNSSAYHTRGNQLTNCGVSFNNPVPFA